MKTMISLFLLCISMSQASAFDMKISTFTHDGCSSWPDGPVTDPDLWADCCYTHDLHYWMGGTSEDKIRADEGLKECVNERKDSMGSIMYYGVRAGGSANFPTPWRWGYGWPQGRGYKKLTIAERRMVNEELDRACMIGEERGLIDRFMAEQKFATSAPVLPDFNIKQPKNQKEKTLMYYKTFPY